MTTVEQLYGELWAKENGLAAELSSSLHPRSTETLFDAFAALGPQPGDLVVDVGCRDAGHAIELVRRHGVRCIAVDPVDHHIGLARRKVAEADAGDDIEVLQGTIEALPVPDEKAAFIWCRDVTSHVDQAAGLAECRRVLRPGGRALLYQTFATEELAPREAARLFAATAQVPDSMDPARFRRAVAESGLEIESVDAIDSEWREAMIEDGSWDPGADLLAISRLRRREATLVERYGRSKVEATLGGDLWGIYQLLGKLCPTVFVLARPGG